MIELEALAEERDRQYRSEYRNEMHERRRSVGADQFDAAVEAEIAEQRREHAHKRKARQADGVENKRLPASDFPTARNESGCIGGRLRNAAV